MSQSPPPPYAGPPAGGPPAVPPGGRAGRSNRAKFWFGFLLALPAMAVGAFVTSLPSWALVSLGVDPSVGAVLGLLIGVAELGGLVALVAVPRTRWWGIGLLAGIATAFIVLAGACVVLLVALSNASYG